ncbi:MAG: glutamate 5-kinase [Verrucomicrobiia bacterium]
MATWTIKKRFNNVRSQYLKEVSRIVVKFGTGILTNEQRQLDPERVSRLVEQVAEQHTAGREVIIVTSGAVGAGMVALGFEKRPTELSQLQACAAVGQSRLMSIYSDLFSRYGITVAQVLLTHDDVEHHDRHLNVRNTLVTLLNNRVIPIINENDVVSTTELKFGDNDRLSALVATLLPADLLVILTSVDGLIENYGSPQQRIIPLVQKIDSAIEKLAGGTASQLSVGGMKTKIDAAKIVVRSGIPLVIASGKKKDALANILAFKDEGTLFIPNEKKLKSRKRWIAFFHHPKGALFVDEGAKTALREKGKSLLRPGIIKCEGEFEKGDIIRICDIEGTEFARGITRYSSSQISKGDKLSDEVVHRNDLVIL